MSKKLKVFIIVSVCVLLLAGLFTASFLSINTDKIEYRGFTDISEFNKVDSYAVEEIDPSMDSQLNNMKYSDNYCKTIIYNNNTYKIFAYVFESEQNAADYCDLKVIANTNYNYKYSGNIFFHNTLRVYSGKCAYIIEGNNHSDFAEFYKFLSSEFTVIFK
ncbi:MAG: hypothetical protein IKK10_04615 [Clostridia bacterium]|nr:hypothetical protein [Clostridia bacterium]